MFPLKLLIIRMKEKIDIADYRERPKELLVETAKKNKERGSSTFVIASLSKEKGILNISYIGDSGKNKTLFNT